MEASNKKVKRVGILSLTSMFVAYCCSVTSVPNGAIIGEGASFKTGFWGIMLGWLIGSIIVALTTYITYKTGKHKDLVWREMFGRNGSRICSFLMAFCMAFWACFDFFNGGQALYNLMPEGSFMKNMGFCIAIIVLLVVTIIGGVYGTNGVKWISTSTVPVAIVLFVVIYIASVDKAGGLETLMAYVPEKTTLNVASIAQIMVGMWMAGFLGIMDLATEAKNTKSIIVASVCGVGFIMLCFLVGQVGFIGTELKTLGDICASLGGAVFICGSIFVIVAQGNTTPACNLMYGNSFAAAFRMKRTPLAIIVPIIAAILAFVIMYGPGVDFVNNITNTVSTLMGPLIGVTIAEFYVISKRKLEIGEEADTPAVRPAAVICLVVGLAISFALKLLPWVPVPAFFIIVLTGLAYIILRRGLKMS